VTIPNGSFQFSLVVIDSEDRKRTFKETMGDSPGEKFLEQRDQRLGSFNVNNVLFATKLLTYSHR